MTPCAIRGTITQRSKAARLLRIVRPSPAPPATYAQPLRRARPARASLELGEVGRARRAAARAPRPGRSRSASRARPGRACVGVSVMRVSFLGVGHTLDLGSGDWPAASGRSRLGVEDSRCQTPERCSSCTTPARVGGQRRHRGPTGLVWQASRRLHRRGTAPADRQRRRRLRPPRLRRLHAAWQGRVPGDAVVGGPADAEAGRVLGVGSPREGNHRKRTRSRAGREAPAVLGPGICLLLLDRKAPRGPHEDGVGARRGDSALDPEGRDRAMEPRLRR